MLSHDSDRYFSRLHMLDATRVVEGECVECGKRAELSTEYVCAECGEACLWCGLRYNPFELDNDPDRGLCGWCKDKVEECVECGELFDASSLDTGDWYVCDDCGAACEVCERWYPESRMEYYGPCVDGYVCSICQDNFYLCDNCQCYYYRDDIFYDEAGYAYCTDCFEDYGYSRHACLILGDWQDRSGGAHETVGWEIEFSDDVFYHCEAEDLRPYYGQSYDLSVCAELATHIWDSDDIHAIEGAAESVDGLGDQGLHHGLHITIGQKGLGIDKARSIQKAVIELMQAHAGLFVALSGRQQIEIMQWAAFAVTANKYSACNLRYANGIRATWEFRLWRSVASKTWILARVGISLALIRAARAEVEQGNKLTLSALLEEIGRLPQALRESARKALASRLKAQVS